MGNCANVGSCHGGSVDGPYQWLHQQSKTGSGISYDTSNPYMACSSESDSPLCQAVSWEYTPENVARTCSTFAPAGFCGPIKKYSGGIVSEAGESVDHVISVVGWGQEGSKSYWIVRNSWGEYWGEMGYVRVEKGNNALQLESQCAWAVPDKWTEGSLGASNNFPCFEDGTNCGSRSGPSPSPPGSGSYKCSTLLGMCLPFGGSQSKTDCASSCSRR